MSNCTGIIFGRVTDPDDGSPTPGVQIDLNWIQAAEGGALPVGGNDALTTYVPKVTTTSAGEYLIPFFWASERVPGDVASAHAMRFYDDSSYTSMNLHGQVFVGIDVRKLLGNIAPPLPSDGASAWGLFFKFWQVATPELKGLSILSRFAGSLKMSAIENQGIICNIDFPLPYAVGSF